MDEEEATAEGPIAAVESSMYRPLAVLRVILLLNALGLFVFRGVRAGGGPWTNLDHVGAGVVVMALVAAWTAVAIWGYAAPRRRVPLLLVADLVVAVGAVLVTPLVKGDHAVQATLPGFWVMGAVLAWAIHWSRVGGIVAGVAVSLADLLVKTTIRTQEYGNMFLLIVGGLVVGGAAVLLKEMAVSRDRAQREATQAAERAQLARVVHDGVLQVLALVQRRGLEQGGEAAELGRLAGEQEARLRGLVQAGRPPVGGVATGVTDLVAALSALGGAQVTVSVPGRPVELPATAAGELLAAVTECLANVRRHAGPDARVWIALEETRERVVVSVRDDGPGIPAGRLDQARAAGRLGVAQSIRGRLADLGGTATLVSQPGQGAEWELAVPRG